MNPTRTLQWLNLAGVLALAGLCAWQWQDNRAASLDAVALDKLRQEHEAQLAKDEKAMAGQRADLDALRERLAKTTQERDTAQTGLAASDALLKKTAALRDALVAANAKQKAQLEAQADQFQKELENWKAAVAARDAELKKAGVLVEKIAKERNADIERSNALVKQYNQLAKDREEAVTRYNNLVEKYNALAKQVEAENARVAAAAKAQKDAEKKADANKAPVLVAP